MWDYLILSASNPRQAAAYELQLAMRRSIGLLSPIRHTLVVADPEGRRVGSGGSTLCCLLEVIRRESGSAATTLGPDAWRDILAPLRILMIHAGGDSRRLPAYGPCGKLFVPVPGEGDSALGLTLFDRQLPVYLALPPCNEGAGQVVIAAGDVLLRFEPKEVRFAPEGVTGLGCMASPEQASKHGVYCLGPHGQVRRFLQKPSPGVQLEEAAVTAYGKSVLDIGVLNFDAATAVALLRMADAQADGDGRRAWTGPVGAAIERHGLDFYREICCAFGTETSLERYVTAARDGGSCWDERELERLYRTVCSVPCRVQLLKRCEFLHFGTSRQIIESGQQLLHAGNGLATGSARMCLSLNNRVPSADSIVGSDAWVEGCSILDRVTLSGDNLMVGVDVDRPLALPQRACLDLLPGKDHAGRAVTFVRCYHIDDAFHNRADAGTLCGRPLTWWETLTPDGNGGLWDPSVPRDRRNGWNARLFPAEPGPAGHNRWLWMLEPEKASPEQLQQWSLAEHFSLEEMSGLADQDAFYQRRLQFHAEAIRRSLRRYFRHDSQFSATDLARVLTFAPEPEVWVAELLDEARRCEQADASESAGEAFAFARVLHTLGSALVRLQANGMAEVSVSRVKRSLNPETAAWLVERGLALRDDLSLTRWCQNVQSAAFQYVRQRIVASARRATESPRSALRSDEIVWGRAPARLDLAGGWTDTPPYSLENGGAVLNAAVLLNGQPPVQVYARLTADPIIRLRSIDLGTHLDIRCWDDLFDYASAVGDFSLGKAALVTSGFTPSSGNALWNRTLRDMLAQFGGGIEITTLAAIPKGSGLGTSSIMGAVLLAVIHRVIGRELAPDELFHAVLRLEQELTTGGGWQDQIGGSVGGLKLITAQPGLVPEAVIRYVSADVLAPRLNGGATLLYYTGITRLAKNILHNVVGRYLDRDREAMSAIRQLGTLASAMAEAMARKDLAAFGRMVDAAWRLNKQLDPQSTNEEIESLLARIRPHLYGSKLLGAGGGGFLLLVCKSPEAAAAARKELEGSPPNDRARFFEFDVSDNGISVSVC